MLGVVIWHRARSRRGSVNVAAIGLVHRALEVVLEQVLLLVLLILV
jgi:hypothetical protein